MAKKNIALSKKMGSKEKLPEKQEEHLERMFLAYIKFLENMGNLLTIYGKVEKETKTNLGEIFSELMSDPAKFIAEIKKKGGPKAKDLFLETYISLTAISPALQSFQSLPATKKIEVGTKLSKIAENFKILKKYLEK